MLFQGVFKIFVQFLLQRQQQQQKFDWGDIVGVNLIPD